MISSLLFSLMRMAQASAARPRARPAPGWPPQGHPRACPPGRCGRSLAAWARHWETSSAPSATDKPGTVGLPAGTGAGHRGCGGPSWPPGRDQRRVPRPGSSRAATATRRHGRQRPRRRARPRCRRARPPAPPHQDQPAEPAPAAAPEPPRREVRPGVLQAPRLLEPGIASSPTGSATFSPAPTGSTLLARRPGCSTRRRPNLTRYVFTDPRASAVFPDWDHVADEQAFHLWLGARRSDPSGSSPT